MTDITELAQKELAQLRDELSNQAIGSKDHLRKIALSLLNKLEKCRDREIRWLALSDEKSKIITDQEEALAAEKRICATWRKTAEANSEKLEKAQQRITQLESRTVKLPDDEDGQAYGFGKWSNSKLPATAGTMTIAYCEDAWRAAFEVFSSAAGIKVEAE